MDFLRWQLLLECHDHHPTSLLHEWGFRQEMDTSVPVRWWHLLLVRIDGFLAAFIIQ
jgi:hypothetical protein